MSVMTALGLRSEPEPEQPEPPAPPPPEEPKVTGRMIVGFNVYEWDKDNPASVRQAQHQFMQCLLMGMAAFETVEVDGWYGKTKTEQSTRDFNPETEQIRMTAQFAGG